MTPIWDDLQGLLEDDLLKPKTSKNNRFSQKWYHGTPLIKILKKAEKKSLPSLAMSPLESAPVAESNITTVLFTSKFSTRCGFWFPPKPGYEYLGLGTSNVKIHSLQIGQFFRNA